MYTELIGGRKIESEMLDRCKDVRVKLSGNLINSNVKEDVCLGYNELYKGILQIGVPGTGKTLVTQKIFSQIKNKLAPSDKIIIFTPKSEDYLRELNSRDLVMSFTNINSSEYTWNIFKEVLEQDDNRIRIIVSELCMSLFAESIEKSGNNVFFPMAACDVLQSIIIANIRDCREEELNNRFLLNEIENLSVKKLKLILASHDDLNGVLTYFGDGDNVQALGVISELRRVVINVLRCTSQEADGVGVREFLKYGGGRTLYIKYDVAYASLLAPILGAIYDLAIKEAMSSEKDVNAKTYLFMDEMDLLPKLKYLSAGLSFGRSHGLSIIAAFQNVNQLYSKYGEELGKAMLSSMQTIIAFNNTDYASRLYVCERLGKTIKKQYSPSLKGDFQENITNDYAVEEYVLSVLGIGEAVINLANSPHIYLFHFDE